MELLQIQQCGTWVQESLEDIRVLNETQFFSDNHA